MSLIAQDYQSESEEEGEVDHEDRKSAFIARKMKEIASSKSSSREDGEASDASDDVQITGEEPGFIPVSLPDRRVNRKRSPSRKNGSPSPKRLKRSRSQEAEWSHTESSIAKREDIERLKQRDNKRQRLLNFLFALISSVL